MAPGIRNKLSLGAHAVKHRYSFMKRWRGFGVLAIAYIAAWIYLFAVWYNPWQYEVAHGGDWQLPSGEGVAMFLYLVPGLIMIPGAFYVVWTNLLRKRQQLD